MDFAVVKFIAENDAPGIVCTKWIDYERSITLFPNVKYGCNVMVRKMVNPKKDWVECPIQILGEYERYESAQCRLEKAEITSNLDSDSDFVQTEIQVLKEKQSRKRKAKRIILPGEETSSDEADREPISSISIDFNDYPSPPSKRVKAGAMRTEKNAEENYENQRTNANSNNEVAYNPQCPSTSTGSAKVTTINDSFLQKRASVSRSSSSQSFTSNESHNIEQLRLNQKLMWEAIQNISESISTTMKTMDSKLDKLISNQNGQESYGEGNLLKCKDDALALLMSLPASDSVSFELLEKKLHEIAFRSLLSKHVFHCDGTDIGTFASNLLRKLMTDGLANQYSLSGKASAINLCKPRFDKTYTYKFVFDRCVKKFNSIQEKDVRKVVSDWLSQAKHRKYKKEQRASKKLEQPMTSTADDIYMYN